MVRDRASKAAMPAGSGHLNTRSLDAGRLATVPLYPATESVVVSGGAGCRDAVAAPRAPDFRELPAWSMAEEIRQRCARAQVVCIQGDTGCGKSSVVPLLLNDAVAKPNVAVTQPRRLAAMSLASRVAKQVGATVGGKVGYRVAMEAKVSAETTLSFVTAGWLLMHLAHRPAVLQTYSHIILDEIHERDLDMDLLCLLLKQSLRQSKSLCIVLMSATVDASKFLGYFRQPGVIVDPDPIIVGARRFPTWPFFLDDIAYRGALPGLDEKGLDISRKVCGRQDARGNSGRVDVSTSLFEMCVRMVRVVARPGHCVLIFLPGMAEIEQAYEAFQAEATRESREGGTPYQFIMLHSIIPQDAQQQALEPPHPGHCKVVLSTNIAESSITIPDVRYILDFGIARRMIMDDDRGLLSLSNCWCSKATCMQRRGRCGRLQEGVIIYLFTTKLYSQMPEFAQPEVENVPLDTAYLKAKVLLPKLGTPQELLLRLINSPPADRLGATEKSLLDLGALDKKGSVTGLGRIAVSLPITVRLTRLVLLSVAFGCPCDGIVMASALSINDVFKIVNQQSVACLEHLPGAVRDSYLARLHHDGGCFSEPIAYRNLFVDAIASGARYKDWLHANGVSAPRMKQFTALCAELAVKLQRAVPDMESHEGLSALAKHRPGQRWNAEIDSQKVFALNDADLLRYLLVAAFSPCFLVGEIKRSSQGYAEAQKKWLDADNTCVLLSLKPEGMRHERALRRLCNELAPESVKRIVCDAHRAFVECDSGSPYIADASSSLVSQMPLIAQLLFQLSHVSCKYSMAEGDYEATKLASVHYPCGVGWFMLGQPRTLARTYWRSPVSHLSDSRGWTIGCHWAVCTSVVAMGGGGGSASAGSASGAQSAPQYVRATGVTVLPPAGSVSTAIMVLAFLSGPFALRLLASPHEPRRAKGFEVLNVADAAAIPSIMSFAPVVFSVDELLKLLNPVREALSSFVGWPTAAKANECRVCFERLRSAVRSAVADTPPGTNAFCPGAKYETKPERDVPLCSLRLRQRSEGGLEIIEVGESDHAQSIPQTAPQIGNHIPAITRNAVTSGWSFELSATWLQKAPRPILDKLRQELQTVAGMFGLASAGIGSSFHGVQVHMEASNKRAVEDARAEICKPGGLLEYYERLYAGEHAPRTNGMDGWVNAAPPPGGKAVRGYVGAHDRVQQTVADEFDRGPSPAQTNATETNFPAEADWGVPAFNLSVADHVDGPGQGAGAHHSGGSWRETPTDAPLHGSQQADSCMAVELEPSIADQEEVDFDTDWDAPAPTAGDLWDEDEDSAAALTAVCWDMAPAVETDDWGAIDGSPGDVGQARWNPIAADVSSNVYVGAHSFGLQSACRSDQPSRGADLPAQIDQLFSELKIRDKAPQAKLWANEMGAVDITEILENAEDLITVLALKPLEARRLLRARDERKPQD